MAFLSSLQDILYTLLLQLISNLIINKIGKILFLIIQKEDEL